MMTPAPATPPSLSPPPMPVRKPDYAGTALPPARFDRRGVTLH